MTKRGDEPFVENLGLFVTESFGEKLARLTRAHDDALEADGHRRPPLSKSAIARELLEHGLAAYLEAHPDIARRFLEGSSAAPPRASRRRA